MPKIIGDLSENKLIKTLRKLGDIITRQTESHIRLNSEIKKIMYNTILAHKETKIYIKIVHLSGTNSG